MRTIQMTLDNELVQSVDKIVKKLKTTRSAFTREALRNAIEHFNAKRLEAQHRKGYELHPVRGEEFSAWENEHNWGDG